MKFVLGMVESILEKGENVGYQHFLLFPKCFQKPLFITLSQTTNFRLFQIERVCRQQFQIWWKWLKVPQTGRKHCGKRRKCLFKQFLLFPQCFLKTCIGDIKTRACLERVNPFPNKPCFLCVQVFWKTVGKGEIACLFKQFLLFPQCLLPICSTFCHFHQIWKYRLQPLSVWKSPKFVVWERVKAIKIQDNMVKAGTFTKLSPSFNNHDQDWFGKHCEKKRKCW